MIHKIQPRRHRGHWLFDDPIHGIVDEEFVYGMDTILDILCAKQRSLSRGVHLLFGDEPIPKSLRLDWRNADAGGNWYVAEFPENVKITGWCCATLLKYFPEGAPKTLYFRIFSLKKEREAAECLRSYPPSLKA